MGGLIPIVGGVVVRNKRGSYVTKNVRGQSECRKNVFSKACTKNLVADQRKNWI